MSTSNKELQFHMKEIFKLIDTKSKWTQKTDARDMDNKVVSLYDSRSCKFCSLAALYCYDNVHHLSLEYFSEIQDILRRAMLADSIVTYNDSHTYEEVASAWTKAINSLDENK